MQRTVALILVGLLGVAPTASAAKPPERGPDGLEKRVLTASADREIARLAVEPSRPEAPSRSRVGQDREGNQRGWLGRHPVLVGALIGAGAGAATSMSMDNELFCSGSDEDCLFHKGNRWMVGAGMGAGIGALVGLIVDLSRQ